MLIPNKIIQFESCIYHDRLKTSNIIWDCLPRKNCKGMQKNSCADYMHKTGGGLDRSANSMDIFIKYVSYGAYERPQYGYQVHTGTESDVRNSST